MRKRRRKNQQTKVMFGSLIGCLFIMGIGYSVLTTNLNFQVRANKIKRDPLIDVIRSRSGLDGLGLDTSKDQNLRYSGSSVKNYVSFNNETWRIIGIFEGKVKLTRESIGEKVWDTNGINHWPTSSLATYLNGEYYESMTASAKEMISDTTYYLGAYHGPGGNTSVDFFDANASYVAERQTGTPNCSGESSVTCPRKTRWDGKIALMYLSDVLYSYKDGSTWMKASSYAGMILTSTLNSPQWVWYPSGINFYLMNANMSSDVCPVLYLDPNVLLMDGDGSSSNPYQIGM